MITLANAHSQRWQVPGLSGEVKLIRPEGLGVNRLMVFGEAGGAHEQNDLLPFRPYAQAGSVLERAFRENGIEREHCLLTNTVWWQPWQNETPSFSALELCSSLNQELIEKYKPQCLLALGRTAFTELTGMDELEVLKNRGFIYRALPKYGNLPVVYTYHPSYLARGSGKSRDDEEEGAKTGAAQGGSMALFWVFKRDLRLAHSIARSGRVPEPAPVASIYNPSPEEWDDYYKQALYNQDLLISYDFENRYSLVLSGDEDEYDEIDYSELTQVQISINKSSAMIADWGPLAEYFFKKFMELHNTKLDVNGRGFDRRYVRQMDCEPQGKWVDLQSLWHHFQPDLPRNLQFISSFFTPERGPWKHLMGQDMLTYGQEDSVRPVICYEELQKLLQNFPRHPETQISLWNGYVDQVQTTEVSLDGFEARGVPIDREAQVEVGKELHGIAKEYNSEIQEHIPENLLPVNNKEGYKLGPPEFITGVRLAIKEVEANLKKAKATLKAIRKSASSDVIAKISYDISAFEANLIDLKKRKEEGPPGNRYSVEDKIYVKKTVTIFPKEGDPFKEDRWVLLTEFNPNSSQQMVNYINWKRYEETLPYWQKRNVQPIPFEHFEPLAYPAGIPKDILTWKVPVDRETKKATTGKLEIAKLYRKTKDPVLDLSLKTREVTKLAGTYVGLYNEETGELKKTSWTPGPDGLVHPFYHTNPATGQLGAKDPNSLNYPKHNKRYFRAIRRIVRPPIDHDRCVVEADYKAFHVLTTGFEAGCQTYMRLARLDMHSFFAATRLLRLYKPEELLKETDANLSDLLKSLRKDPRLFNGKTFQQVRDKNAKPAILGYGFGMRGRTLYLNNEESFENEHHANRVILELDEAFPIVAQWKKNVIQEADDKGYLLSRYGYIRWFNCVYSKRMAKPGEWIKPGVHYRNTKWGQILYEHGDDQEACVAFRPANNAFGMTREVYNRMQADGTADKWWSSIPLHDAIVAFPKWEDRDECIQGLKAQMELPSPVLNGLWCQAEFQVSKRQGSWADMEEIKV